MRIDFALFLVYHIVTTKENKTDQEERNMTKQEMEAKLNRKDITGVGVKVTLWNNDTRYYFYEDFEDSKGVDRAAPDSLMMASQKKKG